LNDQENVQGACFEYIEAEVRDVEVEDRQQRDRKDYVEVEEESVVPRPDLRQGRRAYEESDKNGCET